MHAHILPTNFEIRLYSSSSGGFDRREPYLAVCCVRLVRPGEYYVSMLFGEFGRRHMKAVLAAAKPYGVKRLVFERSGEEKEFVLE